MVRSVCRLGFFKQRRIGVAIFPGVVHGVKNGRWMETRIIKFFVCGAYYVNNYLAGKAWLVFAYPAEYYFEQNTQTLHLLKELEYWGRPWDYYLTIYLRKCCCRICMCLLSRDNFWFVGRF